MLQQQHRMPTQLGLACVCIFSFFAFFIYAGSCKNFQFYEFTFWPARRRKMRVMEGRGVGCRSGCGSPAGYSCSQTANSTRPTSVWSSHFLPCRINQCSIFYMSLRSSLSLLLYLFLFNPFPLFLTIFQLHLLCRYLS